MSDRTKELYLLAIGFGCIVAGCAILVYGMIKGNIWQFLECFFMFVSCYFVSGSILNKLGLEAEAILIAHLMLAFLVCAGWWFVTLDLRQPIVLGLLTLGTALWANNWVRRTAGGWTDPNHG